MPPPNHRNVPLWNVLEVEVVLVCLIFLLSLCGWSGDAAVAPLPRGAPGLGEGLLVCMLLGVHLLIQEVTGHFVTVINLQLFLNLNLKIIFHHVNQRIFAAGIQHPLSDATLVPGHRINEDCGL